MAIVGGRIGRCGWRMQSSARIRFSVATGQPATILPLARSDATPERAATELPVSVQFVARHGDEATLFRLAAQLEKARPWFDRKAPVAM